MLCLADAKRIIIVGIPAVGKTTVVTRLVKMLKSKKQNVKMVSFGTVMVKLAKNNSNRDGLRKMSRTEQSELQVQAAKAIRSIKTDILIIDTHAFISTPSGYYPGLPSDILDILRPTQFISLTAKPETIFSRRHTDKSRLRDINSIAFIKRELNIQDAMISACAVHSGAPVMPVLNKEKKMDESALQILEALGL